MIHSVWNLCRACPGKADEKVHTEYKRNYTWHSNYQPVDSEIIKKPPDANASTGGGLASAGQGTTPSALEPQLPRKKKHPEVAYRNHQVLHYDYPGGESSDSLDSTASGQAGKEVNAPQDDSDVLRARSEERANAKNLSASHRSRSADPSLGGRQKDAAIVSAEEVNAAKMTEYQLSFARRKMDSNLVASTGRGHHQQERGGDRGIDIITGGVAGQSGGEPASSTRKSYSMGTIANIGTKDEDGAHDDAEDTPKRRSKGVTEYKAKFKPFSSYLYIDGNWRKPATKAKVENNNVENGEDDVKGITDPEHAWYTEVVERIKKADEYRWRAHGTPIYGGEQVKEAYGPGAITRQAELWSQVHDRTSLLALSLATTPKPRGEEGVTPAATDRQQKAHKSPISGPALAAIHKREIRPVSIERKKSPAAEKKRPPAPSGEVTGQTTPRSKSSPASKAGKDQSAAAVPRPRPVVRPSAAASIEAPAVNGETDGKIWLKPASSAPSGKDEAEEGSVDEDAAGQAPLTNGALSPEMETESSLSSAGPGERRDVSRPCSLPAVNGSQEGQVNGQQLSSPSPLPEPHTGPVPLTTVKSPEELTGVKSPDPESWTVSLETNRGLEWTDGHTPEPIRVKSPPLTSTPFKPVPTQPLSPQSSYEQVPTKPIKAFNADDVIGGLPASPDMDGTPEAIPIGGELESGDVLDRARNRLDQFWSKSK